MRLLDQLAEEPIGEQWTWLTNTFVSSNGTEQRVCNSSLPKRSFSLNLQFDDANDLRRHIAGMFIGAKTKFQVPLYQYGTRLKAKAATGATAVSILCGRTELRAGNAALVFDRSGSQLVTVNALTIDQATFLEPLARPYGVDASICPVATVYTPANSGIAYGRMDHDAKAELKALETDFLKPFLNEFNTAIVPTFNGLPILEARPVGSEFNDAFDTGVQPTDEGGMIDVRSPLTHAQIQLQREFTCKRKFDPADWDLWRAFADTVKGSWKPFYMPTYRQDFAIADAPVPGGTTLTFSGTSYADDWFPFEPFKALAIFSDGGAHYATATAAIVVGGNSQVTFEPPLPAGAAYGANQRVSLLQKVRIANDQIACNHFSLYTKITLTLRTVDA